MHRAIRLFSSTFILLLAIIPSDGFSQGDEHTTLVGQIAFEYTSDIWGYTDTTTGIDYALLGNFSGMSIIDVTTDTANPTQVAFVPGASSGWKDIKTWKNYSYLVSEGGGGLEIVDLTDPTNPVLVINHTSDFTTAHNLYIDENGFAYVVGTTCTASGAMMIFDLSDPADPVKVGQWTVNYIHDVFVRNNTAWASMTPGGIVVIDVTDKANPVEIARWADGSATHSSWLTDDGNYLLVTEEIPGGHLKILDVRDLNNITLVSQYESIPDIIIHDVYVKGDFAYISYYVEGLKIIDISDPTSPGEVGDFDIFPGSNNAHNGFAGTWGVFPYTSSGLVLVGDMDGSFTTARFDGIHANHVKGTVKDAITGGFVSGAEVSVLESGSRVFLDTVSNYKYAAAKDSLTFSADAFGYLPGMYTVYLIARDTVIHDIFLTELPRSSIVGVISDAATGDPIDAEVIIIFESDVAPDKEIKTFTDANGAFSFESLYISYENEVTYPYMVVLPEFPYQRKDYVENIIVSEGVPTEINFELEIADVLLYNGDIGDDYEKYYAEPINSLGVTIHFAQKSVGDVLQASRMNELTYPVAIWYTGDLVNPILSTAEEDSLRAFLDAGGRLFLTGQNIVETLSPTSTLLTDYLHVSHGGNSTRSSLSAISGSPLAFGSDLFSIFSGGDGAGNQDSPDILIPTGAAAEALTYKTGPDVAAVSVDDGIYKIFLTGFGFEGLNSGSAGFDVKSSPEQLMFRVLTWFGIPGLVSADDEVIATLPKRFELEQNYPNPFNPVTTIRYSLPRPDDVSLIIYNLQGQEVAHLIDERKPAGNHQVIWDASNMASGVYLYRLQAGDFVQTRKMVLLK